MTRLSSRTASTQRVQAVEVKLDPGSSTTDALHKVQEKQEAAMAEWSTRHGVLRTQMDLRAREIIELRMQVEALANSVTALRNEIKLLRSSSSRRPTAVLRWMRAAPAYLSRKLLLLLYASRLYRWTGKYVARGLCGIPFPLKNRIVLNTPLFDAEYYAAEYPDVSKAKNLWAHYLAFGADEDRDPHPLFSTKFYRSKNPDVAKSGVNPLVHYFLNGASEGRDPHTGFNTSFYLRCNPDVARSGLSPLLHYWLYGRGEGRRPVARDTSSTVALQLSKDLTAVSGSNIATEPSGPTISIIMPAYNTPIRLLELAIGSVVRQKYSNWQLCIHDDGSTDRKTIDLLKRNASRDERIIVQFGASNEGIARASNAALALARGEYVAMLDHDDEITPDALLLVARALREDPSIDVLYTDQAYIDEDGGEVEPLLKPDWSPELFRGVMFAGHLLVVRSDLARKIGGFDPAFDRVQDFEFLLRLSEQTVRIRHLPQILYLWRRVPGSVAFHGNEKGAIEPLQAMAVNRQLARLGIQASAAPHPKLAHRLTIQPASRTSFPQVTILVGDQTPPDGWVESILERSTYPNLFVALSPGTTRAIQSPNPRVATRGRQLLYDELDSDSYVVWIDSNLDIETPDWIEHLLFYCEQKDVATCSPLILDGTGAVYCAGLILGMDNAIGCAMQGWPSDTDGYAGSLSCAREVSANTGECMMMPVAAWRRAGGSVKYYANSLFEGADLSLRALTQKRRNIATPRVVLRRQPVFDVAAWKLDRDLFVDRWATLIAMGDPYHNPNFALRSPGYALNVEEAALAEQRL